MPTSILLTWIYLGTRRSVLAVIVAHLVDNLAGELVGFADDARPVRVAVFAIVAALVAWRMRPKVPESSPPTGTVGSRGP